MSIKTKRSTLLRFDQRGAEIRLFFRVHGAGVSETAAAQCLIADRRKRAAFRRSHNPTRRGEEDRHRRDVAWLTDFRRREMVEPTLREKGADEINNRRRYLIFDNMPAKPRREY